MLRVKTVTATTSAILACLAFCSAVQAQPLRVVTYNIENWTNAFQAHKLSGEFRSHPEWPEEFKELVDRERREDDEDNWEAARVILDPAVSPDVIVLQECCNQEDLEYFNKTFLDGYFETVHVFATNTNRDQNLAIMIKPGFKVLETRENYHNEPEKDDSNPEGDKLFARGPGFMLIQTPSGEKVWIGTTHQKSKSGNSVPVRKWALAEANRTHEIMMQLHGGGVQNVLLLGDCNDEIGIQEFELGAGGDVMAALTGPKQDGMVLLTHDLAESGMVSYGGYRAGRNRSFIDHAVASKELAAQVKDVHVFQGPMADVASDHYPVVVEFDLKK